MGKDLFPFLFLRPSILGRSQDSVGTGRLGKAFKPFTGTAGVSPAMSADARKVLRETQVADCVYPLPFSPVSYLPVSSDP